MPNYDIPEDAWALIVHRTPLGMKELILIPKQSQYKYSDLLAIFLVSLKFVQALGDVLNLYASKVDKVSPDADDDDNDEPFNLFGENSGLGN